MASEILPRNDPDLGSAAEIEFALVLSRMIDAVQNDPEELRNTIYELARQKLREQVLNEDVKAQAPFIAALESAIRGVEDFNQKANRIEQRFRARPVPPRRAPTFASTDQPQVMLPTFLTEEDAQHVPFHGHSRTASHRRRSISSWIYLGGGAVILVVGLAVAQQARVLKFAWETSTVVSPEVPRNTADVKTTPAEPSAPKSDPLVPTAYGVYAVSDNTLYELQMLPGRAPDMRIAISPAINSPSRVTLPDGHLRFIVFRRDSATNVADQAEIRVIAKISRALSFDASGKPVVAPIDDTWVMRNIAVSYRTAPFRDKPDMYEIQNANPDQALSGGRYALILKGQAFDFSVAGAVTDPKHCLERLAAANGSFYSECKKS